MIIQYQILKPGREHELKINKSAFVQHQGKLVQLQIDLRDARQKMLGLSHSLGLRKVSNIEVLLSDIHLNSLPAIMNSQVELRGRLDDLILLLASRHGAVHQGRQDSSLANASDFEGVGISLLRTQCHCPLKSTSVQLSSFLGSLFMGYVAAPRTSRCRRNCPLHKKSKYKLQFFFPAWFLRYAIMFEATGSTNSGPISCSLNVVQVIPYDHIIWDLIEREDLDGIKNLLGSGEVQIDAQTPHPWCAIPLYVNDFPILLKCIPLLMCS